MIRILDKSIADKIAAGEVIERPISIIKELVENALDAGADSITCEIKNGGKTYIRVTDNGSGIKPEEVKKAFLRHATSKIESLRDLDEIYTLGFRGEALASIAAVTRTELITKVRESKTGSKIILHGGEVIEETATGCPDGTTIIVTDLFYNTPARLKFLKNDGAESGLIIDFMSQIALAYKDIKFRFINNGNILFSTNGDGNRLNTIMRIFKDVEPKNMVPIDYKSDKMAIEGWVSTPAMSRTNRGSQIFFVNGRVVKSKVLEKAVNLAYRERLFEGRYPVVYIFLNTSPLDLDVNIHPNKREIRFNKEDKIISFVSKGIVDALNTETAMVKASNLFKEDTNKTIFKDENKIEFYKEKREEEQQVDIKSLLSKIENKSTEVKEVKNTYDEISIIHNRSTSNIPIIENILETIPMDSEKEEYHKVELTIEQPVLKPFDFDELEITGVLFNTYVTGVINDTFYMIDQHAAQERIFYEQLVGEYLTSNKAKQYIMMPIMINLPLSKAIDNENWLAALENMGFTIDEFGSGTYKISEIPLFMDLKEAEDFVNNFIDNIKESTDFTNRVVVDKLIMMSCKAAIKANDVLKSEEITALIKDLSNCKNPFSCPHGRPTFIKLSRYEIEKMFKRV